MESVSDVLVAQSWNNVEHGSVARSAELLVPDVVQPCFINAIYCKNSTLSSLLAHSVSADMIHVNSSLFF